MSERMFRPGDEVLTPGEPGKVIDVRATPSGTWVFGVEHSTGEVAYFTGRALRNAAE